MKEVKEEIIEKTKFYFDNFIKVHIETNSNRWYNGIIKSIEKEYILVDDRKEGIIEIFFSEIKMVERFRK